MDGIAESKCQYTGRGPQLCPTQSLGLPYRLGSRTTRAGSCLRLGLVECGGGGSIDGRQRGYFHAGILELVQFGHLLQDFLQRWSTAFGFDHGMERPCSACFYLYLK